MLPGVVEGLAELQASGYVLVVVTNQSGVARGYYTVHDVETMNAAVDAKLREHGLRITSYYYCPHHPEGTVSSFSGLCTCRKPRPGLLLRAASDHGIDLKSSWLIGNAPSDVAAGRAAGCRTILVGGCDRGHADFVARHVGEAAALIAGLAGSTWAIAS